MKKFAYIAVAFALTTTSVFAQEAPAPLHVSPPPAASADPDVKIGWCGPVVERAISVQDPSTYENLTPEERAMAENAVYADCGADPQVYAHDLVERGVIVIDQQQ